MIDNKYQLALNYLIENIEMLNRHSDDAFCLPYGSKKKLQELVDKSKPMKLFKLFYDDELCYSIPICQHCGRHFERYYDEQANYCPTCGQRLDWGDGKEVTEWTTCQK